MSALEVERGVGDAAPVAASSAPAPRSRPNAVDLIGMCDDYWRLAQRISATDFVPKAFRGRPESILAALLSGAERGLGPMESLRSVNVIEGRPSLSAEAKRALVLAAGHYIEILETNERRAVVIGRRAGSDRTSPEFIWTIDRARRARLLGKDNWQKYPEAMLLARATSDLCNALFPDVIAGLETAELVQDDLAGEPEPRTRRRTPTIGAPGAPQAAIAPAGPTTAPPAPDATTAPTPAEHVAAEVVEPPAPAPEARSYRHEQTERELASFEQIAADDAAADDDLDEGTPWAPTPDQIPDADARLGRRIHAQIAEAFPGASSAEQDTIRHGLVAVVTRRRAAGPVTSSADLTHAEQLKLSELLTQVRAGESAVAVVADGIELRVGHAGYRYDVTLNPLTVKVTRGTPSSFDLADDGVLPLQGDEGAP